ncbi:MAG: TolB family protein, partial [Puniceicoccales bacterium]
DADKVIFTASMGGGFQLALYEFSTNSAKPVTGGGSDAKEAVWLNDGRHVIFTQKESGGKEFLVILDTETNKRTRISPANFGNASQSTYAY